jgi:Ca2+-binding RTX toxin-like protein
MRRLLLLLTVVAVTLVVASGVALAVNKVGTDGPDPLLRGTNGADNLLGRGGDDNLFSLDGRDNLLGGPGKDNVWGGDTDHVNKNYDYVRSGKGDKNLLGGSDNDTVLGGEGSENVLGEEGTDLLFDGPIPDSSIDTLSGGDSADVIYVNNMPAGTDIVVCGDGLDWVLRDSKDVVAADCENVYRSPPTSETEFGDQLVPPSFWNSLPPPPEVAPQAVAEAVPSPRKG